MANVININDQIQESIKDLSDYNRILGRGLMQPFRPANSGSRALMNSVHDEHLMVPNNGEVPYVQTGYETEFGVNSTSYVESNSDFTILRKFNKFEGSNEHYYLIIKNEDTDEYDIIERLNYKHNTESYGYLWNNNRIDNMKVGDTIHSDDIIKTSIGFDEYGNKINGTNLTTIYLSSAQNLEDSIILSETAAKKLETSLVNNTSITINDNDVLLNLYGNETVYKTFPDIGECVKDGIFCSIRRIKNEDIFYSLSNNKLRDIMLSDTNIMIDGRVADINVYCNNVSILSESAYNGQLYYYYNNNMRFCKEVNDFLAPLAMNNAKFSYKLKKFYSKCRDTLNGKQFFKDKLFSYIVMEVTVIQTLPMEPGDKMSDRYGGKGIVSEIRPDELMPLLDNGKRVEIIKNQSTCINRENIGQLHELSLSFIGMRIIDYFKSNSSLSYSDMIQIVFKFLSMVDKEQAMSLLGAVDFYDEYECGLYMQSIFDDDAIILDTQPYTTIINIDTISKIYDEFDFIDQYRYKTPIIDSNGNIRMVNSLRKIVAGKIYHYRLKQYAEEKFSVTSLPVCNLKNLYTRSKANKMYEAKYTKTPIMFGFMESGDMMHLGACNVVMTIMIYSSSPQIRMAHQSLLVGDPHNINIKLDMYAKNRNAEIINALMATMGVRLVFKKLPKKKKSMVNRIMVKTIPPRLFEPKTNIRQIIGNFDELQMQYNASLADKSNKNSMVKLVMCTKEDDIDESTRKLIQHLESFE